MDVNHVKTININVDLIKFMKQNESRRYKSCGAGKVPVE